MKSFRQSPNLGDLVNLCWPSIRWVDRQRSGVHCGWGLGPHFHQHFHLCANAASGELWSWERPWLKWNLLDGCYRLTFQNGQIILMFSPLNFIWCCFRFGMKYTYIYVYIYTWHIVWLSGCDFDWDQGVRHDILDLTRDKPINFR